MKFAVNLERVVAVEMAVEMDVTARGKSITVWVKHVDGASKMAHTFKRMPGTNVCDYVASAVREEEIK